jgi:hypothetical protein
VEFGNTQNVTRKYSCHYLSVRAQADKHPQRTTSKLDTGRPSKYPLASSAHACPQSAPYSAWSSQKCSRRAGEVTGLPLAVGAHQSCCPRRRKGGPS